MANPFLPKGTGTAGSALDQRFGSAGRIGNQGEKQYAARLRRFSESVALEHNSTGTYEVRHALSIPRSNRDRVQFEGDVDFVLASGDKLVLVDVKLWSAGFYFSLPAHSSKRPNRRIGFRGLGPHVEGKWLLSQNMLIAQERYREHLEKHGVQVTSMVVFVPTGTGAALNVRFLRWPGSIPTFELGRDVEELYDRLGAPEPVNPATLSLLHRLQR